MKKHINIVLVSLNDGLARSVARSLADSLDMLSADCHEMIVYSLANPKEVVDKCGFEYYKKREKGVVRNCSEYLDTVISISFDLFKAYNEFFENSLIVYLALPHGLEDNVPNEIDFDTRDAFLKENAQVVVGFAQISTKQFLGLTLKKLGEYYENC